MANANTDQNQTSSLLTALRMAGNEYIHHSQWDQAEPLFELIAHLSERASQDLHILGIIQLEKRSLVSALALIEESLEKDPWNEYALLNRAKILFLSGRRKEGLESVKILKNSQILSVSNQAQALYLGYSEIPTIGNEPISDCESTR